MTTGLQTQERLNALHGFFMNNFESEMCGLYDVPEEEQSKYRGRANKPKRMWRQAGGHRHNTTQAPAKRVGSADCCSVDWRTFH